MTTATERTPSGLIDAFQARADALSREAAACGVRLSITAIGPMPPRSSAEVGEGETEDADERIDRAPPAAVVAVTLNLRAIGQMPPRLSTLLDD